MATLTGGGTLAAANDQVLTNTGDDTAFSVVVTGTFVGTITLQALYDTTEGWVGAQCVTRAGAGATTTLTAPGNRLVDAGPALAIRALANPWTSGSAHITISGVPAITAAVAAGGGGGGAVTVADGADVAEGTTTDAGIITDAPGTLVGFARGNIIQWLTNFTRLGSLTETAPATDIASSGLNGRLQRIAQRLTSLIAQLPAALVGGRLDVNLGAAPATVTAQGTAAAGAAVTGNPLLIGGSDGTNVQTALVQSAANPNLRVGLFNGAVQAMVRTHGDGLLSTDPGMTTVGYGYALGGSGWDRIRNNADIILLASASRTTTQTSTDITTYNLGGITVILDMTVVGTGSVTVSINGKDPASGKYYPLLTGAAVITNSTNVYRVMPAIVAVANKDVNAYLPRTINIVVTANNANAATYSVGYSLHVP